MTGEMAESWLTEVRDVQHIGPPPELLAEVLRHQVSIPVRACQHTAVTRSELLGRSRYCLTVAMPALQPPVAVLAVSEVRAVSQHWEDVCAAASDVSRCESERSNNGWRLTDVDQQHDAVEWRQTKVPVEGSALDEFEPADLAPARLDILFEHC